MAVVAAKIAINDGTGYKYNHKVQVLRHAVKETDLNGALHLAPLAGPSEAVQLLVQQRANPDSVQPSPKLIVVFEMQLK